MDEAKFTIRRLVIFTEDDYQEAIQLTDAQNKAFNKLIRAIKDCKKTKVYFYQNMEHLGALNGNNVLSIGTTSDPELKNYDSNSPSCLQYKSYPNIQTACSFADDNHFIVLHSKKT